MAIWISISAAICSTLIAFFDAFSGIVVAMLFVSLPFLVDAACEGFKEVDLRLENVARSLGTSQWQTFIKITLPLAASSIFSGATLCWARGISEFAAVMIIAPFPRSASILIGDRFTSYGLSGGPGIAGARPISVLLISICLLIFVVLRVIGKRKRG
jgi:molybdate/tungstate transport system permease protein